MAKKIKMKLPKRIAGVKIPKVVRKGPIAHFLNSSAGQLLLAEAAVAAAAVFTAAKTDEEAVADTLRHPVEGARRVGHALTATGADQSERLAHAFREAGRAFRDALHESGTGLWQKRRDSRSGDAPVKKKSPSRASSDTHH